jgi:hypothetical protein
MPKQYVTLSISYYNMNYDMSLSPARCSAPKTSPMNDKKSKSPCISTEAFLRAPANHLDGLNTASLFTVGYRANTKFFSAHWSDLLFTLVRVALLWLIYAYQERIVKYNRTILVFLVFSVVLLQLSYESFTTTRPRLPPRSIACIFSSRPSR